MPITIVIMHRRYLMLKNTAYGYGIVARGFHWLLFLMLSFSIVAGNFLASMPKGPEKLQAAGMHKSFGVVLLPLILARLVWRLINETPKDPEGTPAIQSLMAHAMHWVLYALMFAQPLVPWTHSVTLFQQFGMCRHWLNTRTPLSYSNSTA